MTLPRMLAVLAAALSIATFLAARGMEESFGFVVAGSLAIWVAAVLIAGVLALAAIVVRGNARLPAWLVAGALTLAGLLVLPVHTDFYTDPEWAESGGGVGFCEGIVPLPELLQNRLEGDLHVTVYYMAGCQD